MFPSKEKREMPGELHMTYIKMVKMVEINKIEVKKLVLSAEEARK